MSSDEITPRVREEAAIWAAREEGGSMTEADRAALQEWLQIAPEHSTALARYRKLSAELTPELPAIFEAIELKASASSRRNRFRRKAWGSAALVTTAALALLLLRGPETVRTARAECHTITLADGSRVELNANTELQVRFGREERKVSLVRGEALFQITKDPSRPFVVDTPYGRVQVTGTVFDVRAASRNKVEITVIEGQVEVQPARRPEEKRNLTPDMQALLQIDRVTVQSLPAGAGRDAAAWRDGQVVFDDTRLDEAMAHFASYHGRSITVDSTAADFRLGGRYSLNDLSVLLDSLPTVLPVRIEHQGSAIFVRKR
jgi:transmembrane sensor